MRTIIVQLTNENALRLLQDLEKLDVIKLLGMDSASTDKLSDRFRGKLPADVAEKLQKDIDNNRKDWE